MQDLGRAPQEISEGALICSASRRLQRVGVVDEGEDLVFTRTGGGILARLQNGQAVRIGGQYSAETTWKSSMQKQV